MENWLTLETRNLRQSWQKYDQSILMDYLVQDVEDPRINVPSILTRHYLLRQLFPGCHDYDYLMDQEIRFALAVNWLRKLLKTPIRSEQLRSIVYALGEGQSAAGEILIPRFLQETFAALKFPNYMCYLFGYAPVETSEIPIPEYILNTFQKIWREVLEQQPGRTISVLEPACGSANDYRFLHTFGIARFLDYTGFDLCEKNIHNARHLFAAADFRVGNVLAMDFPDQSFDHCFVHDLFEHLSVPAMEVAVSEICRVTRQGIVIGFFNMQDIASHQVQPVASYHWNTLSLARTREMFTARAAAVRVIPISSWLASKFHFQETHNPHAYTFYVEL